MCAAGWVLGRCVNFVVLVYRPVKGWMGRRLCGGCGVDAGVLRAFVLLCGCVSARMTLCARAAGAFQRRAGGVARRGMPGSVIHGAKLTCLEPVVD